MRKLDSRILVFGAGWFTFSLLVVAMTWYISALRSTGGDGVSSALDYYDVKLPKISYMGADPPAYYLFCTLLPLGCLVISLPASRFYNRLVAQLYDLGMPEPSICQCSVCFCCCCCDPFRLDPSMQSAQPGCTPLCFCCCYDRLRGKNSLAIEPHVVVMGAQPGRGSIDSSSDETRLGWSPSTNRFKCCEPYLPYVVIALRPLYLASISGLATLTIASLSMGPVGIGVHGLGTVIFFLGFLSMHGCWCFVQRRTVFIWPNESKTLLGIDPTSRRYLAHECLFWFKVVILFGVDGAAANITYYIGESTGTWSHYNFFNRYVKALSQWAVVFTVILTVLVFAYDAEAFPNERDQKSGRCAGVSPRPLESESGSP